MRRHFSSVLRHCESRVTLAAQESKAGKVRKARRELLEPQACEWVCRIVTFCIVEATVHSICIHADLFPWWFIYYAWLMIFATPCPFPAVYKGSWGTEGACRHKSTFVFRLLTRLHSMFELFFFFRFTIWSNLYHGHFQGDTGDRGTPGEKVRNLSTDDWVDVKSIFLPILNQTKPFSEVKSFKVCWL